MQPRERVDVKMTGGKPTITSTIGDVSSSIFGSFDRRSSAFLLDVGDNLLKFDAVLNKDQIDCFVLGRAAYSGAIE